MNDVDFLMPVWTIWMFHNPFSFLELVHFLNPLKDLLGYRTFRRPIRNSKSYEEGQMCFYILSIFWNISDIRCCFWNISEIRCCAASRKTQVWDLSLFCPQAENVAIRVDTSQRIKTSQTKKKPLKNRNFETNKDSDFQTKLWPIRIDSYQGIKTLRRKK